MFSRAFLIAITVLSFGVSSSAMADLHPWARALAFCRSLLGIFPTAFFTAGETFPDATCIQRDSQRFEGIPRPFLTKYAKDVPGVVPHFEGRWETPSWGWHPGMVRQGAVALYFHDVKVGDFQIYLRNQDLRFDIEIQPEFRGTDLYQYFLAQALRECPETQRISARMWCGSSDNAKKFFTLVYGSSEVVPLLEDSASTRTVTQFRKQVYDALYQLRAIQAREANGFGRITKVVINLEKRAFAFVAERGPRGPPEALRIFVDGSAPRELTNNGQMIPMTTRDDLSLGDYPDFDPW